MKSCSVKYCRAREGDSGTKFFNFPADYSQEWRDIVQRSNWVPSQTSVICSAHVAAIELRRNSASAEHQAKSQTGKVRTGPVSSGRKRSKQDDYSVSILERKRYPPLVRKKVKQRKTNKDVNKVQPKPNGKSDLESNESAIEIVSVTSENPTYLQSNQNISDNSRWSMNSQQKETLPLNGANSQILVNTQFTGTLGGVAFHICKICHKAYITQQQLAKHMDEIHKEKDWQCDLCDILYPSQQMLRKHLRQVHEMVQCHLCNELFKKGRAFVYHLKKCEAKTSPTPVEESFLFKCDVCSFSSYIKDLVIDHKKSNCNILGDQDVSTESFEESNLPSIASVTSAADTDIVMTCCKSSLNTDTNSTPPASLKAPTAVLYENAQNCHRGSSPTAVAAVPHCCMICGDQFSTLKDLEKHRKKKNHLYTLLHCDICNFAASLQEGLDQHKETKHPRGQVSRQLIRSEALLHHQQEKENLHYQSDLAADMMIQRTNHIQIVQSVGGGTEVSLPHPDDPQLEDEVKVEVEEEDPLGMVDLTPEMDESQELYQPSQQEDLDTVDILEAEEYQRGESKGLLRDDPSEIQGFENLKNVENSSASYQPMVVLNCDGQAILSDEVFKEEIQSLDVPSRRTIVFSSPEEEANISGAAQSCESAPNPSNDLGGQSGVQLIQLDSSSEEEEMDMPVISHVSSTADDRYLAQNPLESYPPSQSPVESCPPRQNNVSPPLSSSKSNTFSFATEEDSSNLVDSLSASFNCKKCDYKAKSQVMLWHHLEAKHYLSCPLCQFKTMSKSTLRYHNTVCHILCRICNFVTLGKPGDLMMHSKQCPLLLDKTCSTENGEEEEKENPTDPISCDRCSELLELSQRVVELHVKRKHIPKPGLVKRGRRKKK